MNARFWYYVNGSPAKITLRPGRSLEHYYAQPDPDAPPINARFWYYINGSPVKITLRPGQSLEHYYAQPGDEGWSSEYHKFTHDGDRVTCEWQEDGRDCDGRLTADGEHFAFLDQLRAGYQESDEITYAEWESGTTSQRDEYAEAAGY